MITPEVLKAFGNEIEKVSEKKDVAIGASSVVGGAAAIQAATPLVTGRKAFYHGTTKEKYPKILNRGLIPPGKKGKVTHPMTLEADIGKSIKRRSRNLVYVTPSKLGAKIYAAKAMRDPGGLSKFFKQVLSARQGKNVVKTSIPVWKSEYKQQINPEAVLIKRRLEPFIGRSAAKKKVIKINKTLASFKKVDPEYIKGSKKYKPFYKELGQYIKKRPGRFSGGVALGTAGAAAATYGASRIIKGLKKQERPINKVAEATLKMDSGSNILKPEKKIKTGMPGHVKTPTTVQTEVGGIS